MEEATGLAGAWTRVEMSTCRRDGRAQGTDLVRLRIPAPDQDTSPLRYRDSILQTQSLWLPDYDSFFPLGYVWSEMNHSKGPHWEKLYPESMAEHSCLQALKRPQVSSHSEMLISPRANHTDGLDSAVQVRLGNEFWVMAMTF